MLKINIAYSARVHIGLLRSNNQDNLYTAGISLPAAAHDAPFAIDGSVAAPTIFAVCDGMGGEDAGEVASRIAVQALAATEPQLTSASAHELPQLIQATVDSANDELRKLSGTTKRIGTTLALVVVRTDGIHCAGIGDSRIYCLRRGEFWQISRDHTLAAEHQNRTRSPKTAHMLTRCIGIGAAQTEHFATLHGACRLLICSDGLTDMVDSRTIERLLRQSDSTSETASALANAALRNGGRDNVTVVVLDVTQKHSLHKIINKVTNKLKVQ